MNLRSTYSGLLCLLLPALLAACQGRDPAVGPPVTDTILLVTVTGVYTSFTLGLRIRRDCRTRAEQLQTGRQFTTLLADDLPIPTLTIDRVPPNTSFEFALQEVMPQSEPRLEGTRFRLEIEPARFRCRPCGHPFGMDNAASALGEDEAEAIHFVPTL